MLINIKKNKALNLLFTTLALLLFWCICNAIVQRVKVAESVAYFDLDSVQHSLEVNKTSFFSHSGLGDYTKAEYNQYGPGLYRLILVLKPVLSLSGVKSFRLHYLACLILNFLFIFIFFYFFLKNHFDIKQAIVLSIFCISTLLTNPLWQKYFYRLYPDIIMVALCGIFYIKAFRVLLDKNVKVHLYILPALSIGIALSLKQPSLLWLGAVSIVFFIKKPVRVIAICFGCLLVFLIFSFPDYTPLIGAVMKKRSTGSSFVFYGEWTRQFIYSQFTNSALPSLLFYIIGLKTTDTFVALKDKLKYSFLIFLAFLLLLTFMSHNVALGRVQMTRHYVFLFLPAFTVFMFYLGRYTRFKLLDKGPWLHSILVIAISCFVILTIKLSPNYSYKDLSRSYTYIFDSRINRLRSCHTEHFELLKTIKNIRSVNDSAYSTPYSDTFEMKTNRPKLSFESTFNTLKPKFAFFNKRYMKRFAGLNSSRSLLANYIINNEPSFRFRNIGFRLLKSTNACGVNLYVLN